MEGPPRAALLFCGKLAHECLLLLAASRHFAALQHFRSSTMG